MVRQKLFLFGLFSGTYVKREKREQSMMQEKKQEPMTQDLYTSESIAIAMVTTIQLSGETKQLLSILKEREKAESYEEVLKGLLQLKLRTPTTMFGTLPRKISMTKEDKKHISRL